jgi:hypothetical protein
MPKWQCCDVVCNFSKSVCESGKALFSTVSPAQAISVSALVIFIVTLFTLHGPHQEHLTPVKVYAAWYSKWFALGVLSTIGLGMGTFVLFLGPFIAACASAASKCKSVDFAVFGPRAFSCPSSTSPPLGTQYGVLAILNKVKWEVFVWGVGTAVGHLPGFVLSSYAGHLKAAPLLDRFKKFGACVGSGLLFFSLACVPHIYIPI